MTLTDLINAVYQETNRPDLDTQTKQKVKAATLQLHCCEFFYKDIQSAQVKFDTAAYIQQLETQGLPFFRSLAYIRKDDPTQAVYQQNPLILPPLYNTSADLASMAVKLLTIIAADDILDEYGAEKVDVAYQAGAQINMKSSTLLQYLLMGWYRLPDLQDATFNSWIAVEHPYAIIYAATSGIFTMTGQQDQSRKYDQPMDKDGNGGLAVMAKDALIKSNITPVGR